MIGKDANSDATPSRCADRCRCCHSGVRRSGRRRGSSRARAAHSRKREANRADPPTSAVTSASTSSGSMLMRSITERADSSSSTSGRRRTMPSSACMTCASMPMASRMRAPMTRAQGAWTLAPNGVCTTTRQSPSSSRNRSTTIVVSLGTTEVASRCSRTYCSRFAVARASMPVPAGSVGVVAGRGDRAHERAHGPAQLGGAAERVAVPERQSPRLARCRGDEDPVVGDVLDAPRRRAQGDDVADPRLVDHLLVELPDARCALADEEDAEQSAVRDRAAAGDGESLGAGPAAELAAVAVPHEAGPELGELVRRVPAREHVEHRVEDGVGQAGERRGPTHHREQVVGRPVVHGHARDDLLGEHVEGVARDAQVLDQPGAHAGR